MAGETILYSDLGNPEIDSLPVLDQYLETIDKYSREKNLRGRGIVPVNYNSKDLVTVQFLPEELAPPEDAQKLRAFDKQPDWHPDVVLSVSAKKNKDQGVKAFEVKFWGMVGMDAGTPTVEPERELPSTQLTIPVDPKNHGRTIKDLHQTLRFVTPLVDRRITTLRRGK